MKKLMRKLLSVVAALTMVLGMSGLTAFAAGDSTITIGNAVDGKTYTAYKVFDATYENSSSENVAYTSNETVKNLITGAVNEAKDNWASKFTFTQIGTSENYTVSAGTLTSEDAAAMAAYLADHETSLTKAGDVVAANGSATITGLDKGYYFVTTSTGSLTSLGTSDRAEIKEKNSIPSVTNKKVKKQGTGTYDDSANGSVGDVFNFQITVNTGSNNQAPSNATGRDQSFTFEDKLGSGFSLDDTSFVVKNASTNATLTENTDYVITHNAGTGDDAGKTIITIELKQGALATQNQNITIEYNATLNKNAIGNADAANNEVPGHTTHTYTYNFDLNKIDGSSKKGLEGVKFTLTKTENGKTLYFVPADDTHAAVWQDAENELTTDANGHIDFKGLGAGTYTLTETETLPGYNKLTSPITVTVTPETNDESKATISAKLGNDDKDLANGTTVTVENNQGTLLPSTGGMGTTIFYVLGAALVIGAGVVLVTRRRLSK